MFSKLIVKQQLSFFPVAGCTPVMIWGLFRHGTRYPHQDEIKQEMDLLNLRDTILRNNVHGNSKIKFSF